MSGDASFLCDILGGAKNGHDDDQLSVLTDEPFDDDDADAFSTNSTPKPEDGSQSDDSSAPPMDDRPSSLRLHPLLCPFPQKSSCKINLHHPMTPPLKTLLAINLPPNQTNPRPSPKD
jgi:hypothetical protein